MGNEATIEINRPGHRFLDRAMPYTVWIDGRSVGAVRDGQSERFRVGAGVHHICLGISARALGSGRIWTSQNEEVDVGAGEAATLRCTPRPIKGVFQPHNRIELMATAAAPVFG
jgi:hypothetical protein